MKNIIPVLVFLLAVGIIFAFGKSIYDVQHKPRIEMTNAQISFHRIYAIELDSQTFAVPCQIGDFFRVAADNKTIITSFVPSSNGWAILHFEYLK